MTPLPQRSTPSPTPPASRGMRARHGVWVTALLGMLALPLAGGCDNATATTDSGAGGTTATNSGGGSSEGGSGGASITPCIGDDPMPEWYGLPAAPKFVSWDLLPEAPKDPGSPTPIYQLPDFQPQSCSFRATYGLDQFRNKVTVAALLAGW